jgi:uncharacterized glyoxalase superfamily protein PhnB
MHITGVVAQLRTTDLAASIRFYHLYLEVDDAAEVAQAMARKGVRLAKPVTDTPWGTREFVIKDDQGHTLYVGQRLAR